MNASSEKTVLVVGRNTRQVKGSLDRFTIALNGYEVFSVGEVKGMEFETVFVIPNGMTDNELYVSYTRALNKLFLLDI